MAQERPVTPEKQLLKLIEGSKVKNAGIQVHAIKRHGLSFLSPGAWRGRISFLKETLTRRFTGGGFHQVEIKAVNKILPLCIILLLFYFISSLSLSMINLRKIPNLKFETQESLKSVSFPEITVLKKTASFYLEKVRERDIFKMGAPEVADTVDAKTEVKPPSSGIIGVTQHLRLAGISWSDDPDAMIEDTRTKRTLFVKRGGMIGKIKVQAIFKDKVVLFYDGEEIELK